MSMYYRKKTPRATGAARGFKSSGKYTRKAYVASLRAVPAAYTATRNRAPRIKGSIAPYGGQRELKYVDTDLTAGTQVYNTTGLATPINLLAVGDDNTSRDGRQVTIKSVQVRGVARPTISGATEAQPCRLRTMLVWDNANNSAATSSATLIAAVLTAATSLSFPLVDNANRFTILWDSASPGNLSNNDAYLFGGGDPICIDFYKKMDNTVQYSGTTAAIGSIQNGALWLVTLGDQATTNWVFYGNTRVRFTDQ